MRSSLVSIGSSGCIACAVRPPTAPGIKLLIATELPLTAPIASGENVVPALFICDAIASSDNSKPIMFVGLVACATAPVFVGSRTADTSVPL